MGPGGGLEKCLLGIPDLRNSKFCLDGSKPEKGERITLTVNNMVGKQVRKSFNTTYRETGGTLSLAKENQPQPLIRSMKVHINLTSCQF